jgi:hypothetical protein
VRLALFCHSLTPRRCEISGLARKVGILLAVLLAITAAATADDSLDGLPIVAIHFERNNIFDTSDPKTHAWFYRWANALHIVSKEDFLRSMLLFKEGDPYSADLTAESARILRALGIMNPVYITAQRVDHGVEVTVETHDHWTLQIGSEAGLAGNRSSYGINVDEENLLGWGKSVGVAYESDNERSSWSYRYFDPNVFSSRWQLLLLHADLSDGLRDEVRVDRPFYSLDTPWSWGAEGAREELSDHLYSGSESVVSGDRDSDSWRLWAGVRLPGGGDVTRRLTGGWTYRRDLFSGWEWEDTGESYPTPDNLLIAGPTIGYQQVADRFLVVNGFRTWDLQEDVALGPNFSFGSTFSLPTFGGDQTRWLFAGGAHAGAQSGHWLYLGDAWLSGRVEDEGGQNLLAGVQLGAAELGTRGWQTRLLVETSHELDLDRQLTLGADVGLRGWDPDYFDGTGRALLNLQWRSLIKREFLGLFSVGFVVFGDAGITWDPRVGPDTDGARFDAGVGLLFDLSHLSRSNLLRVDVAFPDDGSGPTITVSTSSIFRLPNRLR